MTGHGHARTCDRRMVILRKITQLLHKITQKRLKNVNLLRSNCVIYCVTFQIYNQVGQNKRYMTLHIELRRLHNLLRSNCVIYAGFPTSFCEDMQGFFHGRCQKALNTVYTVEMLWNYHESSVTVVVNYFHGTSQYLSLYFHGIFTVISPHENTLQNVWRYPRSTLADHHRNKVCQRFCNDHGVIRYLTKISNLNTTSKVSYHKCHN